MISSNINSKNNSSQKLREKIQACYNSLSEHEAVPQDSHFIFSFIFNVLGKHLSPTVQFEHFNIVQWLRNSIYASITKLHIPFLKTSCNTTHLQINQKSDNKNTNTCPKRFAKINKKHNEANYNEQRQSDDVRQLLGKKL